MKWIFNEAFILENKVVFYVISFLLISLILLAFILVKREIKKNDN